MTVDGLVLDASAGLEKGGTARWLLITMVGRRVEGAVVG